MEESFPYLIDPCLPVESDVSASLGHRWVYCAKSNLIVAACDNKRIVSFCGLILQYIPIMFP